MKYDDDWCIKYPLSHLIHGVCLLDLACFSLYGLSTNSAAFFFSSPAIKFGLILATNQVTLL